MKEFIKDFKKRSEEINIYFDLVDKIENLGLFNTKLIIFPSGEYTVNSDIQKILKSHCYLLLYNLVESSIRNGITAIHECISTDKLTYKDLSPLIKKLWLLNDQSKSFRDSSMKSKTVANNLQNIIESVLDNKKVSLNSCNIPISGNLNAENINELIHMYGFFGDLGVSKGKIDNILNFVVRIRCDLAHGNVSFCDASNQISWSSVVSEKNQLIEYLNHILQNIDNYIDNKKYKI